MDAISPGATSEWMVTIDATLEGPVPDNLPDDLLASLAEHGAAVGLGRQDVGVTLTVKAPLVGMAVATGSTLVTEALRACGAAVGEVTLGHAELYGA